MRIFLVLFFCVGSAWGQVDARRVVDEAVEAALARFPTLKKEEIAITASIFNGPKQAVTASYRGDTPIYPASVVKMFYLEAAHRWMEEGKLKDSAELRRAMKDMIVLSYNEATHYVVDVLTGTTSGPELPSDEMEAWARKRNVVNRYFESRGFERINVNQKPWCEGPYGRDRIFVGETYTNRNMLTTSATARLLFEIAIGSAVSAERSKQMLELMSRDVSPAKQNSESQVAGFIGGGLPEGAKSWSKAGWTSTTRHDAALVELPNGKQFILVVFTVNHAGDRAILPFVAKTFVEKLE